MIRSLRFWLVGATVALGVLGCSDSTTRPSDNGRVRADQYLAPGTILLEENAGNSPVILQTDSTLVLSGSRNDIQPGSIVLSTVGTGALRKVEAVSVSGGNTFLTTTQASLVEAFDSLRVMDTLAFAREVLGDIASDVPGLTFQWVRDTTARLASPAISAAAPGVQYNRLRISYDGLSLSRYQGMSLTGSTTLGVDPLLILTLGQDPGAILPHIQHFRTGLDITLGGSITLTAQYGGDLSVINTLFDRDIGLPIQVGFLKFQPHLKIQASVSGTASSSVSHTQSAAATVYSYADYLRGTGWTWDKDLTATLTASESNVGGALSIVIRPIIITLSFELWGIAGPYGKVDGNFTAVGAHTVQGATEGIDVTVMAGVGGEVGLSAHTPSILSKLFEASWTPVAFTFDIVNFEVFHQFFPYSGLASIVVGDNGPAPDDIFEISLDGTVLGQTDRGGTGSFHASNLVPGAHTLAVRCLDDGANGLDVCTLGISLRNGLTFANGSTSLSDLLNMSQSKSYAIRVPAQTSTLPTAGAPEVLPPSSVQFERPRHAQANSRD